jgi:hypothetical protein
MIKQCFECKTDIKFKENYSKVRKRACILLEHAEKRRDSFNRLLAENGGKVIGLKNWPRVLVTVDHETGMPCIPEDHLTKRFEHYDTFQSLRCVVFETCSIISLIFYRHDGVKNFKWILMEWIPTVIRTSLAHTPKRDEIKRNKEMKKFTWMKWMSTVIRKPLAHLPARRDKTKKLKRVKNLPQSFAVT